MEYLEGIDLERVRRALRPQPDARVVHILRQVCGSLAEAHARGLVHRDIKPANVLLCRRGGVPDLVKVLDFGLAKSPDGGNLTHGQRRDRHARDDGARAVRGRRSRRRALSDLYAVGCVAYALLTGRNAFEGELARRALQRPPHEDADASLGGPRPRRGSRCSSG